jgi:ketosteroid isomerase-like protein
MSPRCAGWLTSRRGWRGWRPGCWLRCGRAIRRRWGHRCWRFARRRRGTFTGTHNGVLRSPAGDIPPTGRPVTADYIQVLRFRDGKHASFSLMYDRLQMLEQLGLIPAPAG